MIKIVNQPSGITRGTDATPFARIGDKKVATTTQTTRTGKAMSQNTALQVLAKILLNI